MQVVGFDPTPPGRPVPETSALDHSATLADIYIFERKLYTFFIQYTRYIIYNIYNKAQLLRFGGAVFYMFLYRKNGKKESKIAEN